MKRFRFGPGLLVTAAFIGPGTIVTASRAGAGYGVTLLWAVLFSVAATVILQDMAARVGLAGRRGLAEAIRDSLDNRRIRVGALGLITVTILVGNAAFQTGNLIGASLGLSLLSGLPQEALALVGGGLAAGLLLTGTYQTIQNALVCLVGLMSIVFCAVAGLTAPDIGDLIAGVLIPRLPPRFAADCLGAHRHDLRLLQPVPPRQHRAGTLARRQPQRRKYSGKPPGDGVLGGPRRPHHGGSRRRRLTAPRTGSGRGERRRGRRTPGTAPRSRRAGLLRPRALPRRVDEPLSRVGLTELYVPRLGLDDAVFQLQDGILE